MAFIVMTDDGVVFDGTTPDQVPLGGAEAAFVSLAEGLGCRGHRVLVRNRCAAPLRRRGVEWTPLAANLPSACDLYIGNRGHRLIGLVPQARRRVFWLHNPGDYLLKPRYLWPLLRHQPVLVFSGAYHATTVPRWVPSGGRAIIPYGMAAAFRGAAPRPVAPPPHAVFTSNPLRGLGWLLDLWETRIHPQLPEAELHLYCGPAVYGAVGGEKAEHMAALLARADALAASGVRRHAPVARPTLIEILGRARVMLYRGDPGETFCLAVAEAQALGVPAVVQRLGSVPERVIDGVTGTVADDPAGFAAAALALLRDDALWRRQHEAALARQQGLGWDEVAQRFETLIE